MIKFTSVFVKNYVLYKEAKLKFVPGVTFILGKNLNRRIRGATNAAGKSLISSALSIAIRDTHTVVTKGGKAAGKSLYGKNTSVRIGFEVGKKKYVYERKGNQHAMIVDGKNLHSRVARKTLESLLTWTDEEWLTTIHVDGRRTNGFLLGTTADRLSFITRLFRLDEMDELRRTFGKIISSLQDKRYEHDSLVSAISTAREYISSQPKGIAKQVEKLTDDLDALQASRKKYQNAIHQAVIYDTYTKVLRQISDIEKPVLSKSEATSAKTALLSYSAKLQEYKRLSAKHGKRLKEIARLESVIGSKVDDLPKMEKLYNQLMSSKPEKGTPVKPDSPRQELDISTSRNAIATFKSRVKEIRQILQRLKSLEDKACCPTCDQELVAPKKFIAELKEELGILTKRIAKGESLVELELEWQEYEQELSKKKVYDKWALQMGKVKEFPMEEARTLATLKASSIDLVKPAKPTNLPSLEEIDDIVATHNRLEVLNTHLADLKKQISEKPKNIDQIKDQLTTIDEKIKRITSTLPQLESIKALVTKAKQDGKKALSKKNVLAEEIRDLPVYELLQKAYSNKGVKQLIIAALCKTLENNLNTYAKHTFEEGFIFKIQVEGTRFDITVVRKGGAVCDIRNFSGAEGRLFSIVFLLALLPMIPSSRRANILILDEPTSNMDTPMLDTFRDVLLPQLAKIVPSVLVISPNHEIVPQNARVITAVKEGAHSVLKYGEH